MISTADVKIIFSEPGLGPILGARVLAKFGDGSDRYTDVKSQKTSAGASRKKVVIARFVHDDRLILHVVLAGQSVDLVASLLVRPDYTIATLHVVLQMAFSWTDAHLHRYVIHGTGYSIACEGPRDKVCPPQPGAQRVLSGRPQTPQNRHKSQLDIHRGIRLYSSLMAHNDTLWRCCPDLRPLTVYRRLTPAPR